LQQESLTKTLVFTFGFDVTAVIARLSELNLSGREHLIFIVPETSSSRAIASQKSIENHIAVLNTRGFNLSLEFLHVNERYPNKTIAQIFEVLNKHDRILVELSGGLRYLILATYIASCLLVDKVEIISTRLETDGSLVTIPLIEVNNISTSDFKLLQNLWQLGNGTQRQLSDIIERRISSVSRNLARLKRMGLVEVSESYPQIYKVSPLGEVFLKRLKASREVINKK